MLKLGKMQHKHDVELQSLLLSRLNGKEIAFKMGISKQGLANLCKKFYPMLGFSSRIEMMGSEIDHLKFLLEQKDAKQV